MGIISDRERNFSPYLLARLLFVSVILGLALIFLAESSADRWRLLALFSANLFLVTAAGLWFKVRGADALLRWLLLSLGVALDTAVIHYTGGEISEFVFLYFFSIGAASLFLGLWGAFWIASLAEIGYAFVLLGLHPESAWAFSFQLFLYAIYFALTAALTGYLAERLRTGSQALETARRELSQTRLDTETILKSLGTGLLALTKTGEILYFNPAGRRILGIEDEGNSLDAPDSDTRLALEKFLAAVDEYSDNRRRTEAEIVLADGRCRPVGFSIFPLRSEAASERGRVILFTDLTAAKQEERERRRQERLAAVGELAKDLAHEIRNPLATISGCVQELARTDMESVESEKLQRLALLESRRLNNLIRDFSAFARLEAPQKKRLNLSDVLEKRQAGRVPLDVRLPLDLPVQADPMQLELVMDAVLLTLSLWAEDGDRISIRQPEPRAGEVSVEFCLRGKVLPDEVLDVVFQPFGEISKNRLGLALPTALRAVEGHGGQLKLSSRPEKGTWFELILESEEATRNGGERRSCGA